MYFVPQLCVIFYLLFGQLRTRRFSDHFFDPPEPQIIGKI